MTRNLQFPPSAFTKQDLSDDADFYRPARLVTHLDRVAIAALTSYCQTVIPTDASVLDLMSSWVSHLPSDLVTREVIGHGMNAAELAANPRLDRWFVQNLNRDPILPLLDQSLDAALCCVSVQYLQQPIPVFVELRRTLRAGAPLIVSFSNRCFPTKAIAIWRALDGSGQASLVRTYLEGAGFSVVEATVLADGRRGDPLTVVSGRA